MENAIGDEILDNVKEDELTNCGHILGRTKTTNNDSIKLLSFKIDISFKSGIMPV